MKKTLLIWLVVLIIGTTFSIVYAFGSGSKKYQEICLQSENYSEDEYFQKNLYGFENCDPDSLAIGSVLEGFVITTLILQFFLIISTNKMSFKTSISFLAISVFSFLFLIILEQILLNSFQSIGYKGWQDAGWTISHESYLTIDFKELDKRPTAFPIEIIVIILFSITTSFGLFLSGLLYMYWKGKIPKVIGIFIFFIVSIILQLFVYIFTFPITLWMSFSYM